MKVPGYGRTGTHCYCQQPIPEYKTVWKFEEGVINGESYHLFEKYLECPVCKEMVFELNEKYIREEEITQLQDVFCPESSTVISELIKSLIQFSKARDWEKYHAPENLCKSIIIEASELLELYQWESDPPLEAVGNEIADVFIYLLILTNKLGLNLKQITENKIEINKEKYPV